MPKGPIPLKAHAALEPIVAIVLIAAPWIFGFDDVDSATAVSIAVGVLLLISGMTTRWRLSLMKLSPLAALGDEAYPAAHPFPDGSRARHGADRRAVRVRRQRPR